MTFFHLYTFIHHTANCCSTSQHKHQTRANCKTYMCALNKQANGIISSSFPHKYKVISKLNAIALFSINIKYLRLHRTKFFFNVSNVPHLFIYSQHAQCYSHIKYKMMANINRPSTCIEVMKYHLFKIEFFISYHSTTTQVLL